MSIRQDTSIAKYYFLSLDESIPNQDKQIITCKGDVLTLRIVKLDGGVDFAILEQPNDSLICDLEIKGR